MLILRRTLIGNRARPGGFLKKTFFSAFMPRSAGTQRMLISRRMLIRIQLHRAPIACCANAWLISKTHFLRKNEKYKMAAIFMPRISLQLREACFSGPSLPETWLPETWLSETFVSRDYL